MTEAGFARVKPRQFQRAVNGIRPVTGEKALLQRARRKFAQQFRQKTPEGIEKFLGTERHPLQLRTHGADDFGVANPHAVHAMAAEAVDELAPVYPFNHGALTGPFQGGVVARFGYGFPVIQPAAVHIVVE